MLLTGTHLLKQAVAFTLLYSALSMQHPQVLYEIVFSVGLNGIQVDYQKVNRKNDKLISTYTQLALSKLVAASTAYFQ